MSELNKNLNKDSILTAIKIARVAVIVILTLAKTSSKTLDEIRSVLDSDE